MKTPFLHLARRLTTATPASWFPGCLQEATGYSLAVWERPAGATTAPDRAQRALPQKAQLASRAERLRPRHLATVGALFAAPGYPPLGGLLVLPASDGLSPVTAADQLRAQLAGTGRAHLDAALADPRLLAHIDLGAPPATVVGAAALQFLRDRHAIAVGHFLHGNLEHFDATSVCVQLAGLPANLALWLAAVIAGSTGAERALVITEDDDGMVLLARQRPLHVLVH